MKKIIKFAAILAAMAFLFASCDNGTGGEDNPPQTKQTPTEAGVTALSSLKKLGDFSGVYTLEYDGDYCLDKLLATGAVDEKSLLSALAEQIASDWKSAKTNSDEAQITLNLSGDYGCASIVADNAGESGGKIYGRNFDWHDVAVLLIHTKPYADGYESFSTSCLEFIELDADWQPSGDVQQDAVALGAIYVPMDGMNEKGLYISNLEAGDDEETAQTDDGKTAITTTVAIRLVLDRAATVDEAVALLKKYNMHSVHKTAHHFAIADSTGKSVVVEWHKNTMYVTETKIVTNHYISSEITSDSEVEKPSEDDSSLVRFNTLKMAGENASWKMSAESVRDALKSAAAKQYSNSGTHFSVWSAVFEPSAKRITYYFREDYEKPVVVQF